MILARQERPADAVAPLRRSADISSRFDSTRERITTLLALGQALHAAEDPAQAATVFRWPDVYDPTFAAEEK